MIVLELATLVGVLYIVAKARKIDNNTELYVRFEAKSPSSGNRENNPKSNGTSDSWIAADNSSH